MLGAVFEAGDKYRGIPELGAAILSEPGSKVVVIARQGRRREADTDGCLIVCGVNLYSTESLKRSLSESEPERFDAPVSTEISLFPLGMLSKAGQLFLKALHFVFQQIDAPSVWLISRISRAWKGEKGGRTKA